jgi:HK97 family phage major capsid protein
VTRRMIQQSTLDIEALIRDDLAQSIATAMDLAALAGTGSSGQPTGIKTTSGINTVSFGAAVDLIPTFAQVVQMETEVAADNALQGNLAYILPASMYGALKTVEKAANTAQFVIEPGGTMNGYKAIVSNQCTAGDLYFGNFSDLLVGMWGGLDILVDPYTNSKSGTILIRAIQSMDVAVRHPVSFCLGQDA